MIFFKNATQHDHQRTWEKDRQHVFAADFSIAVHIHIETERKRYSICFASFSLNSSIKSGSRRTSYRFAVCVWKSVIRHKFCVFFVCIECYSYYWPWKIYSNMDRTPPLATHTFVGNLSKCIRFTQIDFLLFDIHNHIIKRKLKLICDNDNENAKPPFVPPTAE